MPGHGAHRPTEPARDTERAAFDGENTDERSPKARATGAEGVEQGARDDAGPGEASEARLAKLTQERDHYLELAQRLQADFDNYKKRSAREQTQLGARAKAEVVSGLLSVVDNLERALCVEHDSAKALKEGVELVYRELLAALSKSGVERFGEGGEAFDPNRHEAVGAKSAEDIEAGVVLEVTQTGYRLDGAVIRPARVVVSN